MIKEKKSSRGRNGFTLVELLAVIVILAIILVIAVPKVMSIIEDAKKGTLESTAKMIASAAEKAKVQNTVLGNTEEITCDSVAKLNNDDYASCNITFDGNTAKVTIEGNGKFNGLSICDGTKTNATATEDSCTPPVITLVAHIEELLKQEETLDNGLVQTTATYNETNYDAGIRYVGTMDEANNNVYYNCDNTDSAGVEYGAKNYNYATSCEVWKIIGVFDTKTSVEGDIEKRVKLINTASTFEASWDSSYGEYTSSSEYYGINSGYGINQWGESTYEDGSTYEGADLMRFLNGYYIGRENSTCTYCNGSGQETCSESCTSESLKNSYMKKLTNKALQMIDEVLWDTYAMYGTDYAYDSSNAQSIYLYEKGISSKSYGNLYCSNNMQPYYCTDTVIRTPSWIGLVGLAYASDIAYADGWLYSNEFSLTPTLHSYGSGANAFYGYIPSVDYESLGVKHIIVSESKLVFPSVYLKSEIKVIDGNGIDKPYILAM